MPSSECKEEYPSFSLPLPDSPYSDQVPPSPSHSMTSSDDWSDTVDALFDIFT